MTQKEFWEKFMQHEVAIHAVTKKQFNAFIRLCTDKGIQIRCIRQFSPLCSYFLLCGELPPYTLEYGLIQKSYLRVFTVDFIKCMDIPIVEFTDIFGKKSKKYPIITITCDGYKTTAELIKNGKVAKEAVAKCNPKDDFNYQTGVELAIDRLFAKPYHIVKQDHYEVGDKVKIVNDRTRGMNEIGLMDHWLGKVMTIRSCDLNCYRMKEDIKEWRNGWFWQDEMIEGKVVEDE